MTSNHFLFSSVVAVVFCTGGRGLAADPIGWVFQRGGGEFRWVEVPAGSGAYAVEASSDGTGAWNTFFYTNKPFPRGKNLRCTFRWWWIPGKGNGGDRGTAITGPWHGKPAGEALPYADGEAMIDGYFEGNKAMRYGESGVAQRGPAVDDTFHRALRKANSRDASVLIRVTLGDAAGAKLQWSRDEGATWQPVFGAGGNTPLDTTKAEAGSQWSSIRVSDSREAYVGFCPGFSTGRVFYADIKVENDDGPFRLADPDPARFTQGPTIAWLSQEDLMPAGKRYQAEVPDTLDLAERARIAVGGLTNFLDHRREYSTFCHGFLSADPPYMVHGNGQSQNWGKVVEALILARRMCGSKENLDKELATLGGMMSYARMKMQEAYPVPLARMMTALIALHSNRSRNSPRRSLGTRTA